MRQTFGEKMNAKKIDLFFIFLFIQMESAMAHGTNLFIFISLLQLERKSDGKNMPKNKLAHFQIYSG